MSLRDEIQFAIDEIKKGKTEEDKRNVSLRIVAGWTRRYIEEVKQDLSSAKGASEEALKRSINQKTGIKFFDIGEKR